MTESSTKIGIDNSDGIFHVARIKYCSGRPEIKALFTFEKSFSGEQNLLEGGKIIFSVPDNEVIMKKIILDNNENDCNLRARFEMEQSLLEDEKNFCFETITTGKKNNFLGLIVRKQLLEKTVLNLSDYKKESMTDIAYQMRAVALAKGYLNFCRLSGGELISLVDINKQIASIAFIYRNKIIDLTYMVMDKYDINTNDGKKKLSVDLRTVINFKLAGFLEQEISVPLSSLVVSGQSIDEETTALLKNCFPIDIETPKINPGFLSTEIDLSQIPLEKYLLALGLTVN